MKQELILICLMTLTPIFAIGWYLCFRKKIFAWIDFLWSLSFLVVIALYQGTLYFKEGQTSLRLIDGLFILWSLRLSSHLFKRINNHGEDRRYEELKKKWKIWYGLNFFLLFQIEAVLTIVLSIPLFLNYQNDFNFWQGLSLIIFSIALIGESISDFQLKKFIKNTQDPKLVCNVGLWKYSRHPNYFFEWMIWVSFAVYGLSSDEKWPALIPVALMYFLLTKVTGIPPAEASSLRSKKESYQLYQKQTNAFFPWIPKKIIFIFAMVVGLSSNPLLASGGSMQQEKIKYVFNNLRFDNMKILDDFYASETEFIDPLGKHHGIKSVKRYYENLYKNVNTIHFKYNDLISSGNTHVLIWTMTLTADGLNGGKPVSLEGSSHIKFNDANLVIYHRDYFDMGEFIYEHIPGLGWILKQVKNKLRGE